MTIVHQKNPTTTALTSRDADALASAIRRGSLGDFRAQSPIAACLMALLDARGWRGTQRELSDALPHYADNLSLADLRNVMAALGFQTIEHVVKKNESVDHRLFPSLFISTSGKPHVLCLEDNGKPRLFDGETKEWREADDTPGAGRVILLAKIDEDRKQAQADKSWAKNILTRMRSRIWRLVGMTFLLNLLALVGPLYIMAVYDQIVASGSARLLVPLSIGLILAAVIELGIRRLRARAIAVLGGRLEYLVSRNVLRQILSFPVSRTEQSPLSGQISRIREFDNMREMFVGTLVSVLLELPFVAMFLLVIGLLAGWLVLIPLIMIALFATLAMFIMPALRRSVAQVSRDRARQYQFLIEFVTNLRTIRESNAADKWYGRYRDISAATSLAQFRNGQITFLLQTMTQTIMLVAGGSAIVAGTIRVLDGSMTAGALIAVMVLVWRVLSPIQNLFLTMTRTEQIRSSVKNLDQVMTMPVEETRQLSGGITRKIAGSIGFNRVSFRYVANTDPVLLGVQFQVSPGEMIAIVGPNGSGKSTLLHLMMGLYQAQAGQVSIDNLDVRQFDAKGLRQQIAYVPQQSHIFHGTIAQNLRMSNPVVGNAELEAACRMAGLWDEIQALPYGLETRFGDQTVWQLNAGFRQRLSLARAYLRDAPIWLLDEPAQMLDDTGDRAFVEILSQMKGRKTIMMVSHRPSHIRMADRVLRMDQGILVQSGTPAEILDRFKGNTL